MADGYKIPGGDHIPIQTRAERRGEIIQGILGGMADFAKTVVTQTVDHMASNAIPQGRDELTNALFHGDAYWPGSQADLSPGRGGVHGPAAEMSGGVYGTAEITPRAPPPASKPT